MNGDETRAVFEKLDKVSTQLGDVQAKVAGLSAEVKTTIAGHGKEIGILFGKVGKVDDRVRKVELDYIPRARCKEGMEQSRAENREDHDGFGGRLDEHAKQLDEQGTFGGKILGGAIVVALVAGTVISWALDKFAGSG